MKEIRTGVIGAGARSASYIRNVPAEFASRVRLTAVADPSEKSRSLFAQHLSGGAPTRYYESAHDLLNSEELDALVVGSPNHTHAEIALAAFEYKIPLLLEKPVATNVEDCRRLWQGYQSAGQPPVVVGFVLRYTPFYAKIKELVESNALGQILSIDADENINPAITSVFYRNWRRYDKYSGGFMVEKCSHDFDILNWITGAKAVRVFSIAKRTHLTPRPRAEQHRRFDAEVTHRMAFDYGDPLTQKWFQSNSDESLYEAESDVPDHQSVILEFDNGILSNFTACHIQPRNTRRMRVFASNGALEGDIGRNKILMDIPFEDRDGFTTQEIDITHDQSDGHHGGDSVINEAFWGAADGKPVEIRAGLKEGIEAVLVGLAAEESKKTGLPVEVGPMRQHVFGSG